MKNAENFLKLETSLQHEWKDLLEKNSFVRLVKGKEFDHRLMAIYMIQTYHYTLHNSRNQALVGVRAVNSSNSYVQFCFHHATEETGHEMMAYHDLCAISHLKPHSFTLPRPLLETEALIGYLYWISATGNPLQRLGYSYWAESSYQHINPLIQIIMEQLKLKKTQMTFFIAHSDIDDKHAQEVKEIMASQCKNPSDWEDVERVMVGSLRLTGQMLEGVAEEYRKLLSDPKSSDYASLFS